MKTRLLLILLFALPLILSAQDTIFVKTGQVIPAIIVEKNDMEIKYRKVGQAESAAIYSVFVSDLKSIHYKDGIIADYTQAGQPVINDKQSKPIANAGTMKAMKFSLGGGAEYFNRNTDDALLVFWRDRTANPGATIEGNPLSFPVFLEFSVPLGYMQRNWFGGGVQFIGTPSDAINATEKNGSYEISLKNFYTNIIMDYSRSLNHKNNLLATIETGIDLAFMSGYIKLNNKTYDISGNSGMGFHIALGTDWLISKRFTASLRGGYRSMKIEVMYEDNSTDPPKYYNFFVDPPSEELLKVKWNGPYVNFGLKWSFYIKMKSMVAE